MVKLPGRFPPSTPLSTPLEKHPPLRHRTCRISRFATAIGFFWRFWVFQRPRASPGNQPPQTLSTSANVFAAYPGHERKVISFLYEEVAAPHL